VKFEVIFYHTVLLRHNEPLLRHQVVLIWRAS